MKKTKKMVIFVFAFVLAILMSVPANADIVSSSKVTATIDSQLQAVLKESSSDERIPVDIWLYESSSAVEREQKIYSRIGVNKAQLTSAARGTVSSEQINTYIATERSLYAAEKAEEYASFRIDYSDVQALQTTRKTDTRLFYSQYAPMISAELTPVEIRLIARDSRVETICYSPNVTLKDEGDISLPTIGADYTRDTLGYTGSGIKIGMIESGLPSATSRCFAPGQIHYDSNIENVTQKWTPHASKVAAIMVGKATIIRGVTYEGIVPDAELYATCFDSDIENDWRVRVEWLLSQGVHVINMSAGLDTEWPGCYSTHDRWVDHIANDHNVHFVKSAGNALVSPDGETIANAVPVTSPGMAYNAITVGSIDDGNSTDRSDDVLANDSCYEEHYYTVDGPPTNKPDLVAPGVNITTAVGTDSGSSFAAPHVTAVVAQLCEWLPSMAVLQPVVKAVLTASISHSEHKYTPANEEYDMFGAGVVNARAAFETINAYRMLTGYFPYDDTATDRVYDFTASANQRVRVSLTWLKYAALHESVPHTMVDPSDYELANLDLYIMGPDGSWVAYSRTDYYNTEIVDFKTTQAGTYYIDVVHRSSDEPSVTFGLAWWFE